MSTIAIYKIFGEKNVDNFEVAPRRRASRRSMRAYSVSDVADLPPTVVLESLNNTFQTKKLELFDKIKIGRQVSPKTCPEKTNGYFNSRVLSRTHAEVWLENGQVYIKDLKSSNGTYLNNRRLSPEGIESQPFQLKNEDLLDFGIDILETDKTEFKKVSCKVTILRDPILNPNATISSSPEKQTCTPRLNQRITAVLENQRQENISKMSDVSPSTTQSNKLEEWKARIQTELKALTSDGFEINQLTSVLDEVSHQFGGCKRDDMSVQEAEQTKAQLERYKNRCHSLENALNQSNKALKGFETIRSKVTKGEQENSSTWKEANSETEKLRQQVARIMEEARIFRNESSKHQVLLKKQVAELTEQNKRLSVENRELKERLFEENQSLESVKKLYTRTQDTLVNMGKRMKSMESELQQRHDNESRCLHTVAKEIHEELIDKERDPRKKNSELRRQISSFDVYRSMQTPEWKFRKDDKENFPGTIKVKECNVEAFGTGTIKAPSALRNHKSTASPLTQ